MGKLNSEKYLVHACLEGPEAGVYYRGQDYVLTSVEIVLPDYVQYIAIDFTVNLTPIGLFAELYCTEVKNGKFTVFTNNRILYWNFTSN